MVGFFHDPYKKHTNQRMTYQLVSLVGWLPWLPSVGLQEHVFGSKGNSCNLAYSKVQAFGSGEEGVMYIFWANYNDVSRRGHVTLNGGLIRESFPKIPEKFRFRNYTNLPRYIYIYIYLGLLVFFFQQKDPGLILAIFVLKNLGGKFKDFHILDIFTIYLFRFFLGKVNEVWRKA